MSGTGVTPAVRLEGSKSENEVKAELIRQVLDLQNTLDALSRRVDSVKQENLKLHSENQVLTQYIENLQSTVGARFPSGVGGMQRSK
eukprot:m.339607 g.339607  ORF g.339607 m.339607 type:complete len:87 (-) comp18883_c0_seq1:158-418(-)